MRKLLQSKGKEGEFLETEVGERRLTSLLQGRVCTDNVREVEGRNLVDDERTNERGD